MVLPSATILSAGKSPSSRLLLIRTLRPMRAPSGMKARLPISGDAGEKAIGHLFVDHGRIACADDCAGADDHLLVHHYLVEPGAGANPSVVHDHAVLHDRAWADVDARAEDAVDDHTADDAAVGDHAGDDFRLRADLGRRAFLRSGVDRPLIVVEVQGRIGLEQFKAGRPIGIDRADIYPVAFEAIGIYPVRRRQAWTG